MALLIGQGGIFSMHGKIGFRDIDGHIEGELVEQVRIVGVAGM